MLPSRHRMRRSADFTAAVRGGARRGSRTVVVHFHPPVDGTIDPTLVGLVVSKAVGNAVERNRVKRRLRGILASRVDELGNGARLVVRALPPALESSSTELAADVDAALSGARRRASRAVAS